MSTLIGLHLAARKCHSSRAAKSACATLPFESRLAVLCRPQDVQCVVPPHYGTTLDIRHASQLNRRSQKFPSPNRNVRFLANVVHDNDPSKGEFS